DGVEVERLVGDPVRAQLDHAGANADRLAQDFSRHSAGRNAAGRFARRRAAAAAMVAHAVFGLIGVVGVAGAEGAGDLAIVLGALVGVLDHQTDRRAGGDRAVAVVEDAGQDADLIGLLSLGDEAAAPRLPQVEQGLDV